MLVSTETPTPATGTKNRRRGLWITLAAIAAFLIVLGGGGAVAYAQYYAPTNAAGAFCADLKTQGYHTAYGLLSTTMTAQLTEAQFVQASQALDSAEGKVKRCDLAQGDNSYQHALFGATAMVRVVVSRDQVRQGDIHLKSENGLWKIDALATSLLGVNLKALLMASDFCAALHGQNYGAAYALLDPALQATMTQDSFAQLSQAHDVIDGEVTACALAGVGADSTDATATLTVSITRAKLGQKQGTISLTATGSKWAISEIAPAVQGSDLGSLAVADQFCAALVAGDVAGAYQNLTADSLKAIVTQDQFVAFFQLGPNEKYVGCRQDLSTYQVASSGVVTFDVTLTVSFTDSGRTVGVPVTFFMEPQGGVWKVRAVRVNG